MNDLSIIEAPDNLEDGIDGADVRQESITETSTGGSTTSQTSNVVDSEVSGDSALGVVVLAEPVVSLVGNDNAGFFRIDGGIREVGGVAEVAFCDGLEEG